MKRTYDDLSANTNRHKSEDSPRVESSASAGLSAAPIPSLKATISSLPRVPQISRKVRACSACKKQKIRCDFDSDPGSTGEAAKCVRCRKMKLECVVNRSLQTILDEDVEWKQKMNEELAQLQRAVEDILRMKQMRPLSAYSSPAHSAASSCSPGISSASLYTGNSPSASATLQSLSAFSKDALSSLIPPPGSGSTAGQSPDRASSSARQPMTRENSPESQHSQDNPGQNELNDDKGKSSARPPFYDHYVHSASLSTNPMGSLYEVTRLKSLRSNSTTNVHAHSHGHVSVVGDSGGEVLALGKHSAGPSGLSRHMSLSVENNDDDLISRGLITLEEAEELFELFRSTLNHYLFDVALVHDNLTSVRNSSSLLLASILAVASLHRPPSAGSCSIRNSSTVAPTPSGTFGICYQHFLKLVSESMFDFPGGICAQVQANGQPPYTRALDHVRALCIAAFWLPDLSWKLSGHAVRIATELNLHQSFRKALQSTPAGSKLTEAERMRKEEGRKFHYERARLWYLLYVCDHHFSIAYGRPPVICYTQHEAIRNEGYERYLTSDLCKEGDFRVVSQMALFVILERIYECFAGEISEGGIVAEEVLFGIENSDHSDEEGDEEEDEEEEESTDMDCRIKPDPNEPLFNPPNLSSSRKRRKLDSAKDNKRKKKKPKVGKVDQFNQELDDWREIWAVRLRKNAFVGDYPAKGVQIHYHFAKLQLNSLALRGVATRSTAECTSAHIVSSFTPQRLAMARLAIQSARHVLTTILTVEEIRVCLIGVPLYVHTMTAFAAVFLMKVASRWRKVEGIADLTNPAEDVWRLVENVVEVLRDVAGGEPREVKSVGSKGKGSKKGKEGPSLTGAGEMHIIWYIAGGLEKMVKKFRAKEREEEEAARAASKAQNGKWEAVWQGTTKPVSSQHDATMDDPAVASSVPPSATGLGPSVAAKPHEHEYVGNWSQQPQPNFGGSHHSHSPHHHYTPSAGQSHHDRHDHQAEHQAASTLQQFAYSAGPSHSIYTFNNQQQGANSGELPYDTNPQLFNTFPVTQYEFFPGGPNSAAGVSNANGGGGYFSFAGFDLFGGGTMEAIPIAGAGARVVEARGPYHGPPYVQPANPSSTQP